MFITSVPNRNSRPCILLRESYREGGKVRSRTLTNLTHWPPSVVDGFRKLLNGGTVCDSPDDSFDINRTLPYGHVAAVLSTIRSTKLDQIIYSRRNRKRDLVLSLITARIISPQSKLATARGLHGETCSSALSHVMNVSDVDVDAEELYDAMDWALQRQRVIEDSLAKRHLRDGSLVLYDITSTYFEGKTCPLAKLGHSRDGKKGTLQIVFGLLCSAEGCPVAVEVFDGNTGDPKTLSSQVQKIRQRFKIERVIMVGDRGLITAARIQEDLRPIEGFDWITALRAPAIKKLVVESGFQMTLLDEFDLAEITSPDYPDERLVVCRNPMLALERREKRESLLKATEEKLAKIAEAVRRPKRSLRGKGKIGLRIGKVINKFKMEKHFDLVIGDDHFSYSRDQEKIMQEASLDGLYILRTRVPKEKMTTEKVVEAYKSLSRVERAFRCIKTVDLRVRPIFHRLADRVRAHVFLCMLAYYVEWHMRQMLAPMLFQDDDPEAGRVRRKDVVAPARRSKKAEGKAYTKRGPQGDAIHSFQSILEDLGTIALNFCQPKVAGAGVFTKVTLPTDLQKKALTLLGVDLDRRQ